MKIILPFILFFSISFFYTADQFHLCAQENNITETLIDNDSAIKENNGELNEINNAFKFYQQQDWIKAKEEFEKIIEKKPESYRANLILGNIYSFLGEYDKSITQFKKCSQIHKNKYHPYFNMGLVYLEQKKYKEALDCFNKTDEIIPDDYRVIFKIGEVYFFQGDYKNAMQYFQKTYLINNQYHKNIFRLAETYHKLNMFEEESQLYKRLIDEKPTFTAYYMLGLSRYSAGDHNGEIEAYKKALEFKFDKDIIYNLGVSYYETGKLQEALAEFVKIAYENGQPNANALYYMAIIYINQGDFSKAWETHEKLRDISAEKADEIYNLLKK